MGRVIFFALTAFVFLGISGCSKDDSADIDFGIKGEWELVNWYSNEAIDLNGDGQASTDLYGQWDGCFKHSRLILQEENGNEVLLRYLGVDNKANCTPGIKHNDVITMGYTWSLRNKNLEFNGSDFVDSYPIKELTSKKMVLEGASFLVGSETTYTGGYLEFVKK